MQDIQISDSTAESECFLMRAENISFSNVKLKGKYSFRYNRNAVFGKNGNTVTLLDQALKGAQSQGAQTQRIDLYDLNYKGCVSCFYCKRKDPKPLYEHGNCL